jgi:LmbE family N-acetylglucosaminyl deacetylase
MAPHRQLPLATPIVASLVVSACLADDLTGPANDAQMTALDPPAASAAANELEVYIHAHQDDWQLFMGDRVAAAAGEGRKIVLVYATAGDAGKGERYWRAREDAAHAAADELAGSGSWDCRRESVGGHSVRRCHKAGFVSWFMRVSDGNYVDGTGYGRGSLALLRDRGTATTALDGSTTYTSWSDFHGTLAAIVGFEDDGMDVVRVHAPDPSRTANPGDHPDHYAAADAVKAAAGSRGWRMVWYVDYDTRNRAVNLDDAARSAKRDAFYAYDAVMVAAGYKSEKSSSSYQAWLDRTYLRTDAPPTTTEGVPGAPTITTAVAHTSSHIEIRWTDGAGTESGFEVQRAADRGGTPGVFLQIGKVSGTARNYRDLRRAASTRYWYRIRAFNAAGNSGYSNVVSVTTPAASVMLAGAAQ